MYVDLVSFTSIFFIRFQGPRLLEWVPGFHLGCRLPYRSVPRGRSYSNITFDPSTSLIVVASSLLAKFASFDEDGNRVWEPDGILTRSL
jgi:cleavage and polyadenylation specificity factor subunit 1